MTKIYKIETELTVTAGCEAECDEVAEQLCKDVTENYSATADITNEEAQP